MKLTVNECVLVSRLVSSSGRRCQVASFREGGDGVSHGGLAECASVSVGLSGSVSVPGFVCVSACVFDLTASLGSESEIISVSSNTFRSICGVSPSPSRKSAVSVAPCCVNNPKGQE